MCIKNITLCHAHQVRYVCLRYSADRVKTLFKKKINSNLCVNRDNCILFLHCVPLRVVQTSCSVIWEDDNSDCSSQFLLPSGYFISLRHIVS